MKKYFTTKTITGLGILTAILVCLFGLSNVLKFGYLTPNYALISIILGACLYGPFGGLFLGFVDGVLNLLVGEVGAFMAVNAWATVLVVILKTSIAGLLAGLIFLPFKKKLPFVGSVISSVVVPVVNTGIFAVGALLFFRSMLGAEDAEFGTLVHTLIFAWIGINFLVEVAISAVLSSGTYSIIRFQSRKESV